MQLTGIEDLYVFNEGEVHLDSNASMAMKPSDATLRAVKVGTLQVQDRGTFELHTYDKEHGFTLHTTNMTVSIV